jgi:predicted nucleic acid-binding protein
LVREGHITDTDYGHLKAAILADFDDADICELSTTILKHTLGCLERNALRAMDAIHVASALTYGPDLFVSADQRQIDAARSEGLMVEEL